MAVGIQLEIVPMLGLRRRRWANIVSMSRVGQIPTTIDSSVKYDE